ncbi:MAG: spore germination protein GerW family protein [Gaiellaceae bacterium]
MPDIDAMLAGAREAMTVSRVFGEPIERGEVTIIPVAQVQGGGGGGGDREQNAGGGFGLRARPVGAFVIRGDSVEWKPSIDLGRALSALGLVSAALLLRGHRRRGRCSRGRCCRGR